MKYGLLVLSKDPKEFYPELFILGRIHCQWLIRWFVKAPWARKCRTIELPYSKRTIVGSVISSHFPTWIWLILTWIVNPGDRSETLNAAPDLCRTLCPKVHFNIVNVLWKTYLTLYSRSMAAPTCWLVILALFLTRLIWELRLLLPSLHTTHTIYPFLKHVYHVLCVENC